MPTGRPARLIAAMLLAATAPVAAAHAQSGNSSGAQDAETGAPIPAKGSGAASRLHGRKPPSPQMDVSAGRARTGPETSTAQPDTNDLSGSTGDSITMPQGIAPPGVAPPNGSAPDSGGAAGDNVPNTQGGPHA